MLHIININKRVLFGGSLGESYRKKRELKRLYNGKVYYHCGQNQMLFSWVELVVCATSSVHSYSWFFYHLGYRQTSSLNIIEPCIKVALPTIYIVCSFTVIITSIIGSLLVGYQTWWKVPTFTIFFRCLASVETHHNLILHMYTWVRIVHSLSTIQVNF